ncbi:TPA_asm: P [Nitraria betacytorhabdovirus 1]|nr:TPA_asm: P [Nitraria betacytorhabdovirus 1]
MSSDQEKDSLKDIKGLTLGDKQSYLASALEELENAQIAPDQLNFNVPPDMREHLDKQRKEATEALKSLTEEKSKEEESAYESNPEVIQSQKEKEKRSSITKSQSWSQFNSPDHQQSFVSQKSPSRMETIDEKNPMFAEKRDSNEDLSRRRATIIKYGGKNAKEGSKLSSGSEFSKNLSDSEVSFQKDSIIRKKSQQGPKLVISDQQRQSIMDRLRSRKLNEEVPKLSDEERDTENSEDEDSANEESIEGGDGPDCLDSVIHGPDELIEAINSEFSKLNMYPSDDHTDHIFFLHNKRSLTKRDLQLYCMGVSKERSISFAKKTLDMMTKLEGLLSLANKNMTTTTTNLKISENNITALHSLKKATANSKSETIPTVKKEAMVPDTSTSTTNSKVIVETSKKQDQRKDKGKGVMSEKSDKQEMLANMAIRSNRPLLIKDTDSNVKESEPGGIKNAKKDSKSSQQEVQKSGSADSIVEEIESEDARKIAALHEIDISDSLLGNQKVMEKLLPMVTDSLIEKIYKGDAKYKETVQKVLLGNLKKQLQK